MSCDSTWSSTPALTLVILALALIACGALLMSLHVQWRTRKRQRRATVGDRSRLIKPQSVYGTDSGRSAPGPGEGYVRCQAQAAAHFDRAHVGRMRACPYAKESAAGVTWTLEYHAAWFGTARGTGNRT